MDNTLRFLCVNVGKVAHSAGEGLRLAETHDADFILVQEPHYRKTAKRTCRGEPLYELTGWGTRCQVFPNHVPFIPKAAIVITNASRGDFVPLPQSCSIHHAFAHLALGPSRDELILIGSVYIPPKESGVSPDLVLSACSTAIATSKARRRILGGDFNAEDHPWSPIHRQNARGADLSAWLLGEGLDVANCADPDLPTFQTFGDGMDRVSWPDVITTSALTVNECSVLEHSLIERHRPLKVEVSLGTSVPSRKPINRKRFVVSKADWERFEGEVETRLDRLDSQCETAEQLENLCLGVQRALVRASKASIPRTRNSHRNTVPWMNNDLRELEKQLARKLRFWLRRKTCRGRRAAYRAARVAYTKATYRAKQSSWEEFCSTITDRDPFGKAFKVLAGKLKRKLPLMPVVRRSDSTLVDTPEEIVKALIDEYFPSAVEAAHSTEDDDPMAGIEVQPDDLQFSSYEVERAIRSQKSGKAPGFDQLPAEVIQRAYAARPELFLRVFNYCLSFGYFPKIWKRSVLCIIPKAGRTEPKASSFRPICLLPVLGKVLDSLMISRINYDLCHRGLMSDNQYGFREGVSTISAIERVQRFISVSRSGHSSERNITLALSLDIEGAFNCASWSMILTALQRYGTPKNLFRLAESYFSSRVVEYQSQSFATVREVFRGCPQGSVSGPGFWNILLNDLLRLDLGQNVELIAYADDVVILTRASSRETVLSRMEEAFTRVVEWLGNHHLSIAYNKCSLMPFTKDLRGPAVKKYGEVNQRSLDKYVLRAGGHRIKAVLDGFKYLGVTLDYNLAFKSHVSAMRSKVQTLGSKFASVARAGWGPRFPALRRIHQAVVEPTALYAAEAWGPKYVNSRGKTLDAIERRSLLAVTRAYRTTSHRALNVMAGVIPLRLKLDELLRLAKAKQEEDYEKPVPTVRRGHPATWVKSTVVESADPARFDYVIYTDGSKGDEGVGAAFVVYTNQNEEIADDGFGLDPRCSVFQSELLAIRMALDWVASRRSQRKRVLIRSDSLSSLKAMSGAGSPSPLVQQIHETETFLRENHNKVSYQWVRAHVGLEGNERADTLAKKAAEGNLTYSYQKPPWSYHVYTEREITLNKWQAEWSSGPGTHVREFQPDVRKALRHPISYDHYLSQIVTGHGDFGSYLARFSLGDGASECLCKRGERNRWHVIFDCTMHARDRLLIGDLIEAALAKGLQEFFRDSDSIERFRSFAGNSLRLYAKERKRLANLQPPAASAAEPTE